MDNRQAVRRTRFWTLMLATVHPATFALTAFLRDRVRNPKAKRPLSSAAPSREPRPRQFLNSTCSGSSQQIRTKSGPESESNLFFDALAQVCHSCCPRVRPRIRPAALLSHRRALHTKPRPSLPRRQLSREDALGMLDYYPNTEDYSTACTFDTTPHFSYPPILQSAPPPTRESAEVACAAKYADLHDVLHDPDSSHEEAWASFQHRLGPRLLQLTPELRDRLLHKLSVIRRRGRKSMARFISVVDELKANGIELTEHQYNSVIAFSAHLEERPSLAGIESALLAWKEMENVVGIKPTNVTFNILFDKATKAGKFALAEVLWKQMEVRGLEVNRFARVSLIFYYGLRGDGQGIRRAYREFIDAGHIVDTVVMNCVIASLIRAGELPAAEQVYERMKLVLYEHTECPIPHLDWKEPRSLGRELQLASQKWRNDPEKLQAVRNRQSLAPSQHTFNIFVDYHATETGEIKRIAQLVGEMHQLSVPICGRIFVKILKGFSFHGGVSYTSWTLSRLENAYASLLQALDQGLGNGKPGKWMVIWAVRAFFRCSSNDRTLQIWGELLERWQPSAKELQEAEEKIAEILRATIRHTR